MMSHRLRPAALLLALGCFCLPWLNIRCNHREYGEVVMTQSGLQMLYGGTTTRVGANGEIPSEAAQRRHALESGDRTKPVPLVMLYVASLLAALAASLLLPAGVKRWAIATGASGLAAALLVIQIALGFPLVKAIPRGEVGWNYTIWFWLALIATIFAAIASLCENIRLRLVPQVPPAGEKKPLD